MGQISQQSCTYTNSASILFHLESFSHDSVFQAQLGWCHPISLYQWTCRSTRSVSYLHNALCRYKKDLITFLQYQNSNNLYRSMPESLSHIPGFQPPPAKKVQPSLTVWEVFWSGCRSIHCISLFQEALWGYAIVLTRVPQSCTTIIPCYTGPQSHSVMYQDHSVPLL